MQKEKIKIEAIVNGGDQMFYVINRPLQMSYTKRQIRTPKRKRVSERTR